ncbi:class II poly(R)-hydroxyalkanoic acid synthase [Enterobacterales bacterium AW_CKDN230030176-1A_HGKHYDSX7]
MRRTLSGERPPRHTDGLNPLTGLPGKDLLASARALARHALRHPFHSAQHAYRLGERLKDVLAGTSTLAPERGDRRFVDPTWTHNPLYRRSVQAYLAWRDELHDWVEHSALPPDDIRRGHFLIHQLTEALAPTNSPANPAALKRLLETGGQSALAGLANLARDWLNNGGMPRQVDPEAFIVGRDVATSEGVVVYRNDVLELIQYRPLTDHVHERPLLIVPPQINRFYVFDLTPDKSLVRFSLSIAQQTFMVSWRNPTADQREWGLSTYVEALKDAIDALRDLTGSPDVNVLGACSGGITCAALAGHYAALGQPALHSLTLLVSVLDATLDSPLALFTNDRLLDEARQRSYQAGVLEGKDLARLFAWMRPNDLVWPYWVNNYLLGLAPAPFDILFWNNDTTRLPAAFHSDLIDLYRHNPLTRAHALEVCGTAIDLAQVRADVYCLGATTDHITPWQACYRSARLFGGQVEFVLSNSGHVQSILNPPGNPKARFQAGPARVDDPHAWEGEATACADSWWLHWHPWLAERSGALRTVPAHWGDASHAPDLAAPGTYVHER